MKIIGHEKIINSLKGTVKTNSLSHAYLFMGPPNVGKSTTALWFAKVLNCENPKDFFPCNQCQQCQKADKNSHPDLFLFSGEAPIKIDDIRRLQNSLSLKPYFGKYKVVILENVECMTIEAANCFLKSLEEPDLQTIFILTLSRETFLPTIISRCQVFKFSLVEPSKIVSFLEKEFDFSSEEAQEAALLSGGRPGELMTSLADKNYLKDQEKFVNLTLKMTKAPIFERLKYVADLSNKKEETQKALSFWLGWFRDILLFKKNCSNLLINSNKEKDLAFCADLYSAPELLGLLERIQLAQNLINENINLKLLLEVLVLNFK